MPVSNSDLANAVFENMKNLPPEAIEKVGDFSSGTKGVKLTNIPPVAYVKSKMTNAIFPYSPTIAQRGDLFEPYYGVPKEPEMSDIEIAFERMKRNATTNAERSVIEQKRQMFQRGVISKEDIVRAGEAAVKKVDPRTAEYEPKVQPSPDAINISMQKPSDVESYLDAAATIPHVEQHLGFPEPPEPPFAPPASAQSLTVEDLMRGIMNMKS